MPKRFKLKNRTNKTIFSKGNRVHPKNNPNPMRGGIRL